MSDKVLYQTKGVFSLAGIAEDEPVFRDEEGACYTLAGTEDWAHPKAYPILFSSGNQIKADSSRFHAELDMSGNYIGAPENCRVSPLSWDVHKMGDDQVKVHLNDALSCISVLENHRDDLADNLDALASRVSQVEKAIDAIVNGRADVISALREQVQVLRGQVDCLNNKGGSE